jgi:hypothetical protein
MRRTTLIGLAPLGLLVLAGCSDAGIDGGAASETASSAPVVAADMAEAPSGELGALAGRPDIPATLPKMAYVFDYGFRLPGDAIAPLQQKHADMCEALGPYSCQIVSLSHSGDEGEYVQGRLQLAVAADKARAFGADLTQAAEQAGGKRVAATIAGEDLSKSIVDTEARLRSRVVLRDRLLEVLSTRRGTVAELVEAERSVAQVNAEIDQARSWLEEMNGRVAFSRLNIDYQSVAPAAGSFLAPIRGALGSLGTIFGGMVAILIVLGAVGLPMLAIALAVRRLRRRFGLRLSDEPA